MPAFVVAALEALGYPVPVPTEVPRALGVQVGRGDCNPLGLPIAPTQAEQGVSAETARGRILGMLQGNAVPLCFTRVPLNEIPWNSADILVEEALANGVVVGVGVRYSHIAESAPPTANHVLRITGLEGGVANVTDDSGESPRRHFAVPFRELESAAVAAGDGLWLFYGGDRKVSTFFSHS